MQYQECMASVACFFLAVQLRCRQMQISNSNAFVQLIDKLFIKFGPPALT